MRNGLRQLAFGLLLWLGCASTIGGSWQRSGQEGAPTNASSICLSDEPSLEMTVAGCFCGAVTQCTVHDDSLSQHIDLDVVMIDQDCDACEPAHASCALTDVPDAGMWAVSLSGRALFRFDVPEFAGPPWTACWLGELEVHLGVVR